MTTGRIALITGGMGGLGEAMAVRLHAQGYRVAVTHSLGNANVAAWLAARPDVVIVAAHNRAVYGGLDALKARPELADSPAARAGKLFEMPAREVFMLTLDSPDVVRRLRAL